ncbi:probable disease resistance protein RF45 [Rosa rugosa]|uniref:probable disease resistance protein RF45 n=1 Tax=Rosa rugosa TaxID=74645 RepID=UPI002B4097E0|nr:probable disease resistance protein RF45 [Rosa rugosa]
MAESILAVVEKLTNLLAEETRLLKGVKDKVETLVKQLNLIEGVVKDADAKQGGNEAYNRWLSQIRDLGYQAVDVIETYRNDSESPGFFSLKVFRLHNLNGEVNKIQSSLKELFEAKAGFGIAPNNPERDEANERRLRSWREPPAIMKEDDFIDLVEDTKVLIAQLSSMDPRYGVVSIVGMGGLGKTTLANKLYSHTKLKFDCKVFISVSKDYRKKEILYGILEGICAKKIDRSEKEEEKDLIIKVHDLLKEKSYLVILDDLWEKEDWDNLKETFPSGMMGSKVMLTTRNREVAKHAGCINPHEPRLLTEDESLELLRKKALPQHAQFPLELEKLGREMVDKCRGLPLAVVVLGGLMSGKSMEEWEILSRNSRWSIMNDVDRVSTILALSYNHLPFHLKLCFQHLGLFPEDFCIPKNELIRLWVAERFLPQQGEDTEEGVAEKCIYELINRSMVLVGMRTSRGRVKAIRIHDVLRDFSISKAKEGNFLEIYSGKGVGSRPRSFESRRLAIHGTYNDYAFLEKHTPHLRSLHFFNKVDRKIDFVYKNSKLLNVLEVTGTEYHGKQDYKALENLTQLRYLGFRGRTDMLYMPSSIGKLMNLQTLDLRHCVIISAIPDVLWKMRRLRHLLFNSESVSGNLKLDGLTQLQTLKGVSSGRWARGLVRMSYMRRLGIRLESRSSPEKLNIFNSVTTLRNLQSLSLKMQYAPYEIAEPFPPLEQLSGCVNLQKLHLIGEIKKLPGADEFPPNLGKLVLEYSKLQKDSIATLEKLPKLKMLNLDDRSYVSCELVCSPEGFPQLEVLHLKSLRSLKEWTVEQGAMMNLKHLMVHDCKELKQVSDGLKSLITLQDLEISRSPDFEHLVRRTDQDLVEFTDKN